MSEPLEPLDPEIAHLFANEPIPAPTRGASARVLGRVAASIAVDAHIAGAGAGVGAGVAKQLGMRAFGLAATTFLLGGAIGAGVATALHTDAPPRVVYVNVPAASTTSAPPREAPPTTIEPKVTAPQAPATPLTAPAPTPTPSASDTLGAERLLIEDARAKLTSGAPTDALAQLEQHARRFPKGHLAEEREALAIQALANAGNAADARARAGAFRSRWPGSVYMPAVEATIHTLP